MDIGISPEVAQNGSDVKKKCFATSYLIKTNKVKVFLTFFSDFLMLTKHIYEYFIDALLAYLGLWIFCTF